MRRAYRRVLALLVPDPVNPNRRERRRRVCSGNMAERGEKQGIEDVFRDGCEEEEGEGEEGDERDGHFD